MTRVVVAGGGFAGLSAALFLARRGHAVTLVERDGDPPDGQSADDEARGWKRPGAPQSHQGHLLLARARRVFSEEAPDVLDAFVARGIRQVPASVGAGALDGEYFLTSRRLVAEATLRRIVAHEPGVVWRSGETVVGLLTDASALVPVACGVRLGSGELLPAELVVDAGGRRSALPEWLCESGARAPADQTQHCGFMYLTRFYRTRAGCRQPPTRVPAAVPLDYATVIAFGADNDTFSVTLTLSTDDPYRARLRDPDCFEALMRMVPAAQPWVTTGDPITEVATMSRIENRRRNLVDAHGPVVGGIVAIGDASLHTNPTLGRGISMAVWQAQHLASEASSAADDPVGFVQRFHDWTTDNLGFWFDSQVAADVAGLDRLAAGLRGERLDPPTDPASRFLGAAFRCAAHDAGVGAAVAAVVHLLVPPAEAFADPMVAGVIGAYLATDPQFDRPPDVPNRSQFELLVTSHRP